APNSRFVYWRGRLYGRCGPYRADRDCTGRATGRGDNRSVRRSVFHLRPAMRRTEIAAVMSPARETAALALLQITVGYGVAAVLHDLSSYLASGEMLAIVGPNGAGKSTLLKVASGLLRPWRGNIELLQRPLASYHRRELAHLVATVAQENQVTFSFTALEIVLMGRAPHLGLFHLETEKDLAAAYLAMERFELLNLAHRRINELSGGERKRVFLAGALAQEPRVMLLDEPTAFLDLRHAAEIMVQFRNLCAES